jgi:hypothetical protein
VILVGLEVTAPQAAAGPTLQLNAAAVPIPGYPDTGNIYGAGAAVQMEYVIDGDEYERSPAPMAGFTLVFPAGVSIRPLGFETCANWVVEPSGAGPKSCSAASRAGPPGEAHGFVTLGGERVREATSVESFYAPGGGLEFFMAGHSPVSVEILSSGHYLHLGGGGFGPELETEIPLVESLPGAPYASIGSIKLKTGSAFGPKAPTKATYYLRLPSTCPAGGWLFRGSVTLAAVAGLPRQTLTATTREPCPTRGVGAQVAEPETALAGTGGAVVAPSNKVCLSRRHFTLHVRHLPGLVYKQVTVELDGRQLRVLRGRRISANIDLRGLPKGYYTVRISVLTTTGRTISGTRAYHTCAPKPIKPKGKARL